MPPAGRQPHTRAVSAFDRRSILLGGVTLVGAGVGAATLGGCPPDPGKAPDGKTSDGPGGPPPKPPQGAADGEMTIAEVLPILVAVADRLLPRDELGPGARDAGVELYLQKALADPRMRAIKSLVTRGAVFLGRAARKEHGKAFVELDDKARDGYIQRLASNEVRPNGFSPQAFVRVMLALTLEAFLGDPRHGGNRGEVGWQFIGGINWAGRVP